MLESWWKGSPVPLTPCDKVQLVDEERFKIVEPQLVLAEWVHCSQHAEILYQSSTNSLLYLTVDLYWKLAIKLIFCVYWLELTIIFTAGWHSCGRSDTCYDTVHI